MSERLTAIWKSVRGWVWPGLVAILVALFIWFEVKPFQGLGDPSPEDISRAWNRSIGRLGIIPLYPPAEDFHVGDVWAVVVDGVEPTLLGKGVRIGHIDMRGKLLADDGFPTFTETPEPKDGSKYRSLDRKEAAKSAADGRISLSLAAFPGITITHTVGSEGAAGSTLSWIGARRQDESTEEIRIPVAETYGISSVDSVIAYTNWCEAPQTKIFCSDAFVRRMVAYAVDDKVLTTKEGKFTTRIDVRLITRVFLMREIEHRKGTTSSRSAALQVASDPVKGPTKEGTDKNDGSAAAQPIAAAETPGAKASSTQKDGVNLEIKEVFQRPLVFGFRAVSFRLKPSDPQPEAIR
ncbi:hypothetical protein ACF1BQ_036820 [Bradyrhizobium sp. RDT10]